MEFKELIGKDLAFYGVCHHLFKLDNQVWEAIEDDDDGYRSYLDSVAVSGEDGTFFTAPIATVQLKSTGTEGDERYELVDASGHVWLTIGTDHSDDYYPYFEFDYSPPQTTPPVVSSDL